jgi:DNA-binding LytR/AlgR family response regulator
MKTLEYKMSKYSMMISGNKKSHLFDYKDIICIRAVGQYTEIIVNNIITPYLISESLINLEVQLPNAFFKCHRSAIESFKYKKTIICS